MSPLIDHLVRARYEQRISIRKMAKRSGLTRKQIREVEHGDPLISHLCIYAGTLGLKVELRAEPIHHCPSFLDLIRASMDHATQGDR